MKKISSIAKKKFKWEGNSFVAEDEESSTLEELLESAESPKDLEKIWKRATDRFVPEMTIKQKGQFKLIARRCGSYAVAAHLIAIICGDWLNFADRAEKLSNGFKIAREPNVPHLLLHIDVALNMLEEKPKEETKEEAPAQIIFKKRRARTQEERDQYLARITGGD